MSPQQNLLFLEQEEVLFTRGLLDQLLTESRLYKSGKDFQELLDFIARLPNFAPFNAMLLQIQKPGLRFAASAHDWKRLFKRTIKLDARPLLILWPFGPVALVYDQMDTEGAEALPEDVAAFSARGSIDHQKLQTLFDRLEKKSIRCDDYDGGDGNAGSIRPVHRAVDKKDRNFYRIGINQNHTAVVRFSTLAHELGHLFLGHLGEDKHLVIPDRSHIIHKMREIEAESVAYLVCKRTGVEPKSQTYLSDFVKPDTSVDTIEIYPIMRAAGQVETILGIASPSKFNY